MHTITSLLGFMVAVASVLPAPPATLAVQMGSERLTIDALLDRSPNGAPAR